MIDVLVISHLATVRAGLAAVLSAADDVRVVGQGRSLTDAPAIQLLPEVAVVLVDAPQSDAVDAALGGLPEAVPGLVLLGPGSAAGDLLRAAPPFAWASLSRDAAPDQIVAAVRAVAAGLVVMDLDLAAMDTLARPQSAGPLPAGDALDALTAREHEVLTLVALGLTNKAIARRLAISDHTVKFHVASVLAKLGAESRTEAVHLATRRGLLTL
ncbi:MAG: LuxR C-terminal-related transcriptional regulator [Chloroflexota bacterium]